MSQKMMELHCDTCGRDWERYAQRGRPPKECWECSGKPFKEGYAFIEARTTDSQPKKKSILEAAPKATTKAAAPKPKPKKKAPPKAANPEDHVWAEGQWVSVPAHPSGVFPAHEVSKFKGKVRKVVPDEAQPENPTLEIIEDGNYRHRTVRAQWAIPI